MKRKLWLILFFGAAVLWGAPPEKGVPVESGSRLLEISMTGPVPEVNRFPLGLYWVPRARMAEVKAAGFNYVIPIPDEIFPIYAGEEKFYASAREYLDQAMANGLKCGFFLDKRDLEHYAAGTLSFGKIARAVEMLKSHPAFLFYYFRDEPESDRGKVTGDPVFLEDFSRKLKELDPGHPTFLVNFLPQAFEDYARIPDIYSIDLYPIPRLPVTAVSRAMDKAMAASGWRNPVWFTVQGFGGTSAVKRAPTPEELRCMTYLALAHGASGIQFFRYCGDRWRFLQPPGLWNEILKVTGELNVLSPLLTRGQVLDSRQVEASRGLDISLRYWKNEVYLFAVNTTGNPLKGEIRLPVAPGKVQVLFEERNLLCGESVIKDDFAPYEVHLYKPESYLFLSTPLRGEILEVGKQMTIQVLTTREDQLGIFINKHFLAVLQGHEAVTSWTPLVWGEYRLSLENRAGDIHSSLSFSTRYGSHSGVWHSYEASIPGNTPGGVIQDSAGVEAALEFYLASPGDVTSGIPLNYFQSGEHSFGWNRVSTYLTPRKDAAYPYAGKKEEWRYINQGNREFSLPLRVRDLAVHPPDGKELAVTAFVIPEKGEYALMDLGIRKNAGCGDPLFLRLYDSSGRELAHLVSQRKEWVTLEEEIPLGVLSPGEKVFFAVGSMESSTCDFGDLRWSMVLLAPGDST